MFIAKNQETPLSPIHNTIQEDDLDSENSDDTIEYIYNDLDTFDYDWDEETKNGEMEEQEMRAKYQEQKEDQSTLTQLLSQPSTIYSTGIQFIK
jgi:hypothetical protein